MIANKSDLVKWLIDQPEGLYECNAYKAKRSLTANSYYWRLLTELAGVMRISREECHANMLHRYGQYLTDTDGNIVCVVVSPTTDISKVEGYYEYHDTYKGLSRYKVIKGSHLYNSLEFSRLLDGLIDECKELGIETMPPDEIRRLQGYAEAYTGTTDKPEDKANSL